MDLRKAYDSVPRQALWCALCRYGIPENLMELVHSFHEGMSATVTVCGEKLSSFPVTNGLRQACTIAPTHFILYLDLVVRCWRSRCLAVGVEVQYQISGKLVGRELEDRCLFLCLSVCLLMMQP